MPQRCQWPGNDPLYVAYHDHEWGVPVHDERTWFEFVCLEGQQAGLSWITILRKRENYREAFHNFDIARVARMTDAAIEKQLQNAGLIRNRPPVAEIIEGMVAEAEALLRRAPGLA